MTIFFRPHHFLCTLGFQGKGYSPSFIKNYQKIAEALQNNDETLIEVVLENDSICRACPHKKETKCAQEEKIQGLDQRHSNILALSAGDVLSWRMAKKRLKSHMTVKRFHQACRGCEWKSLGVCEKALKDLRKL